MSVKRFANAGLNGHFEDSHLVVFKQKLVILWSCGQGVVLGSPPLVEVSCGLCEQETGAKSSDHQYNVRESFHGLFLPTTVGRLQIVAFFALPNTGSYARDGLSTTLVISRLLRKDKDDVLVPSIHVVRVSPPNR